MEKIVIDEFGFEFGMSVFLVIFLGFALLDLIESLAMYLSNRKLMIRLHRSVKGFVELYNYDPEKYESRALNCASYHEQIAMMQLLEHFGYEMCSDGKIRRFTRWEKLKKNCRELFVKTNSNMNN